MICDRCGDEIDYDSTWGNCPVCGDNLCTKCAGQWGLNGECELCKDPEREKHENLVNTLEVYFRSKGYGWESEEEARELAAYLKNRI